MNLNQAIANYFNLGINYEQDWTSISCCFHSDTHASAGLNFNEKMFNCFAGCEAMPFWKLAKELNLEYDNEEQEIEEDNFTTFLDEMFSHTPKLKIRKQAEAYTNFLFERKIKPETIEEFGGYYESKQDSNDYGFLIIPYGRDKYIKRRIIGNGERFRNTTGDSKDLFGRDIASCDSIILVEGVTDYFTLWQQVFGNGTSIGLAATLGAKVSKKQMYLLRNKKVFILFDGDYEGYVGARKAAEYLKEFKAVPIILDYPERFVSEDTKCDANNVFIHYGTAFIQWLTEQINQYNSFDNFYIRSNFNRNDISERNRLSQFSTGLVQVDNILNGGFASGIHGIAGRSGIGKSSLITELTCQAANQDKRVLSLSYELSKEQMWSRIASRYSQYSWSDIEKDKSIIEEDVGIALEQISNLVRIELGWTIDQVLAAIDNFDVVIVDYIQRMEFEGNDTRKGIDINMGKLSNLARDKNKIIFIISSMAETIDNFKESGSILYMCQSGSYLRKVSVNILQWEFIKNTRGVAGKSIYLDIDFAHQRVKETIPDLEIIK